MEWVETTAKTVQEAKDAALDRLGVAGDEAEFEILEEPKAGLFGRMRGQARVRARVRPAPVRPKQERRRRGSSRRDDRSTTRSRGTERTDGSTAASDAAPARSSGPADSSSSSSAGTSDAADGSGGEGDAAAEPTSAGSADAATRSSGQRRRRRGGSGRGGGERGPGRPASTSDEAMVAEPANDAVGDAGTNGADTVNDDGTTPSSQRSAKEEQPMSDEQLSTVTPDEVGAAAHAFVDGLVTAFGASGATSVQVDGSEIAVTVDGDDLGRLVGPKGRTLVALQDLARVASQRRLGDHDTRLKVDVGGYRERRQEALVRFTKSVAETVRATGEARSLEPMNSADRKVVHDVLNEEPGVSSRSEGEDPDRRVVIVPG